MTGAESGFAIRAAHPDDAQGITDMSNLPGHRRHTARLPFTSVQSTRRRLEADDAHTTRLVALHGETVIGTATLWQLHGRRSHVGEIGLGVHDEWVRKGVGAALLDALLDLADQWLNLHRVQLDVLIDNQAAIALYEKRGFEREGVLRDFAFREGRFVDALAMARIRAVRI